MKTNIFNTRYFVDVDFTLGARHAHAHNCSCPVYLGLNVRKKIMSPYPTDFPINQIGLILTRIQTYLHWLSLKLSKTWSTLIIFNLSTLHAALGWRLYTPSQSPFLSMGFIIPACFVEFWWHFALKHQNSLKIFWNRNGCQWFVWNMCGGLILNWLIRIFGWNYLHISKILDVIWSGIFTK